MHDRIVLNFQFYHILCVFLLILEHFLRGSWTHLLEFFFVLSLLCFEVSIQLIFEKSKICSIPSLEVILLHIFFSLLTLCFSKFCLDAFVFLFKKKREKLFVVFVGHHMCLDLRFFPHHSAALCFLSKRLCISSYYRCCYAWCFCCWTPLIPLLLLLMKMHLLCFWPLALSDKKGEKYVCSFLLLLAIHASHLCCWSCAGYW